MVIFSHGLCGNRSMYSTFVAEIASHVIPGACVRTCKENVKAMSSQQNQYDHV